ncbi:MAG: sensor histidine kinase [Eubacteriales bacterium]|nr:sensor histidine kinase [Eubacteriales bacterium]
MKKRQTHPEQEKTEKLGQNRVTLALMSVYLVIIIVISLAASSAVYNQRRLELLSEMDMTLVRAATEYENLTENFWSIYIPIFENGGNGQLTLRSYYMTEEEKELTPFEKFELREVLFDMATRDGRVQWIALYTKKREKNYIYYVGQNTLQPLEADFPYLEELQEKQDVMEIYGQKRFNMVNGSFNGIAIAGGVPESSGSGALLVGYDSSELQQICSDQQRFSTLQFDITVEGKSIFSSGSEPYLPDSSLALGSSGVFDTESGKRYVKVSDQGKNRARVYYSVEWKELFRLSNRNTPLLLLLVAGLVIFSFVVYGMILRMLSKEVGIIRTGLWQIGQKNLDYRIEGNFQQSGFAEIADSINDMAQSLKENIERAYEYELRQKEAEMQELQAKFNPHFLYNSLEMFRARCYQNKDEETAELIAQTASIFRGFLAGRTFIPLQEELAFNKRYLALFHARYGDKVEVLYDFDTEVLEYGIIRNVFQPLIENYFVHGIDPSREDNYIRFQGRLEGADMILITVDDNGTGMEPQKLEELNASLREQIATEKESYGLKNLHQRLRLFYGEPCGLTLCAKESGGLVIQILIRRKRCEDS